MHTDYVRRRTGDLVQQSGVIPHHQPASRLDAQGSHRQSHVRSSASVSPSYDVRESSESTYSDERSIFNAIVSSSVEEARSHESAPGNPIVDQGLAANMAMFVPGGCQGGSSSSECSCGVHGHRSQAIWWRTHMLSDQYLHGSRQPGMARLDESMDTASRGPLTHRKALSLGTVKEDLQRPRWPVNLGSAVKPVLPRYPPPVRAPTPPGLPSFGSPEAIYCSAQFLVRPNGAHASSGPNAHGLPADGRRADSYGDALRRFFGLASSPPASPPELAVSGIGRAEDGTAVQGRFPYRQSAHGTNLARPLHDHPFHRGNLPLANITTANAGDEADAESRCLKDTLPRPRRQSQAPAICRSSRGRLPPTAVSLPCAPDPAVTTRPRKPSKAAVLLSLPRRLPRRNGLSRDAPSAEAMQSPVRGVDQAGDRSSVSALQMQHPTPVIHSSGGTEDPNIEASPVSLDPLSWVAAQTYLCCCLGSPDGHDIHDESLEPTSSHDTYATARSQLSVEARPGAASEDQLPARHGIQSWISSAHDLISLSHPRRAGRPALL